jgi:hypothetical protein
VTPLVFLDTETTGLHPGRQVWEVGMIRRDDAGEIETSFYVTVDLSNADPFGLSVGRFYERHPQGQFLASQPGEFPAKTEPPMGREQAAVTVAHWTHRAHIIGAVPSFDTNSLAVLVREYGLLPAWHYHLIDVENLAVGWLAGQRAGGYELRDEAGDLTPPWDSRQLAAALGLKPQPEEEQHTALGDARWAKAIYDRVMGVSS